MNARPSQTARRRGFSWKTFIAEHLFTYLAAVAGVVVFVSVVLARDELALALDDFDPSFIPVVLGLSVFNYSLRFLKWHRMLSDVGISVPILGNARLYFACLSMVITPARLGELYKLVFLRRLHGISPERSLPPLVLERITDALGVLALIAVRPFEGPMALAAVAAAVALLTLAGWALAHDRWRHLLMNGVGRIGPLARHADRVDRVIGGHAQLLRPTSLAPNLVLSTISWWAECLGLYLICTGLGATLAAGDATWIYALSTLLGNLTFLPGGLGGTEVSLVALLKTVSIDTPVALAATALVRGATLWFAVALGLVVTFAFRRQLQWQAVVAEAAAESDDAGHESAAGTKINSDSSSE